MINNDRIVQEFMELCSISSESKNELALGKVLEDKLKAIGCQVTIDETMDKTGSNTGNIIAFLEGNKKEAVRILFSSHMDTVKPGIDVEPVLENQIITSTGNTILGGDDKSGIAAILEALRIITENNIDHGDIYVVLTVCEEIGLLGSQNVDISKIPVNFGYVLDSDGEPGTIITRGPAQDKINITVHGKAAHAGLCPEEGINAIAVAARAIAKMKLGRIDEETTANIGVISGGKAANIVPELAKMEGEARSLSTEKLDKVTGEMVGFVQMVADKYHARLDIDVERVYPAIYLKDDEPVVQLACKAADNLGFNKIIKSTGGGSDANIFNGYCIPTANLGVGMSKVHTTEEFININDLINCAGLLVEIIRLGSYMK